jgi:small-conductance mechanosensitive channel
LALVLCAGPTSALASALTRAGGRTQNQEEGQAPQDTAPAAAQPIPAADIALRAEQANEWLREVNGQLAPDPVLQQLGEELSDWIVVARQLAEEPESQDPGALSVRGRDNLKQQWLGLRSQIERWQGRLAARSQLLSALRDTLVTESATWRVTADSAEVGEALEATLNQIQSVLDALEETEIRLRERLDGVLTLQNRVTDESIQVATVLGRIDAAEQAARESLLVRDSPALWNAPVSPSGESVAAETRDGLRDDVAAIERYFAGHATSAIAHLMFFLLVLGLAVALRRRSRELAKEAPMLAESARILSRPVSSALIVSLLLWEQFHPQAPIALSELVAFIAIVPIARLLPRSVHRLMVVIGLLFVLELVYGVVPDRSLLSRLILLSVDATALSALAVASRPGHVLASIDDRRWNRLLRAASHLAMLMFGVAAIANLLGNVSLAELLTVGLSGSALLAVALYAGAQVLQALLRVALRTQAAASLRSVRMHTGLLSRRGVALINVGSVASWLFLTLGAFGVLNPIVDGVLAVLRREFTVGSLSVSFGGILTFVAALWAAMLISRFIRFVLQEDVLPHVDLPRGVPGSISKLIHYIIVGLGFFIALAVAGISLDRFALIAGALGVGIGFGLQNIVNNFVSGLILIFERPVQVGDTVEVGTLLGSVQRIGVRSSTVRTFTGAEVIVPNANLISNEVINWTLSDRNRRLEVAVGVKYGTDPQRVLDILEKVAADHSEVLENPPPVTLFRGFGDSSLDFTLRFWAVRYEEGLKIASDIAVAINNALKEAGIEIPFPQRDLHLRSVDPEAGKLLRDG